MSQPDPYQTRPLVPLTQALARPVSLPLAAIAALIALPALLLAGLALWWGAASRPAPPPVVLLVTPTLGLPRAALPALPRAAVAYDAPGGNAVGALEPGRAYVVVARSGLAWAQLDVALPGEPANLVWVSAAEVPELSVAAGVTDLATPMPDPAPQVIYVAAPPPLPAAPAAAPAAAGADLAPLPEPTPAYLIPPATPAPRSVVMREFPTAPPCRLGELGAVLRPCNGIVP